MRGLIAFFVDRSLLVNLITVGVVVFGVVVLTATTRAVLPNEAKREVTVVAVLPGASAVDIERFVTFRLEEALDGMEDVDQITSTTVNSQTTLQIRMEADVDGLTKPLEDIRSRLSAVRHRLPEDLEPLRISEGKRRSNQYMMDVLIENVDETNAEHRSAILSLAERIGRVPNVISVKTTLRDLNLYVRFNRSALDRNGIDVRAARSRILEFLSNLAVGSVRIRDQDVAVGFAEPFTELDALKNLPLVVNRAGVGVKLGQVATVAYGFEPEVGKELLNGKPFVDLRVVNAIGADTIHISEHVRAILDGDAKDMLPAPITFSVGTDVSELIEDELNTLQSNGLGGLVLLLIILTVFLGWRVSAMTALGLPFCYLGIVLLLPAFDINFNLISLVAMILVVGILVDDAIIVSEEFCQRLAAGDTPREAAINAVLRVAKPVLGMVATTTVAFIPLIVLESDASWLMRPLPIIIIAALFLSLFESFLLLPNHLYHLIPRGGALKERRFVAVMREMYGWVLERVLRLRYLAAVAVALLFAATVYLVTGPVKFVGEFNLNSQATIYVELEETPDSLEALEKKVGEVTALIEQQPADLVRFVNVELGVARTWGGSRVRGWKYAMVGVTPHGKFVDQEEKSNHLQELLREPLAALEKNGFRRVRFVQETGGDSHDVVTVYVSGGDRISFTEIQNRIRDTVKDVANVKDVFMDDGRFQRSFKFEPNDRKVLSYDLSRRAVQSQLREHFSRRELMRIRQRGEEIDVHLGFTEKEAPTLKDLGSLTVMTPRGIPVPLSYLGDWKEREVLRRIEHRDNLRLFEIDVLYDAEEVDAEEISDAIDEKLSPLREAYAGYHISVKPSEVEQETKQWVINLLILCLGLIYVCLSLSLNSLVQPIVVIFAIPFGFAGVVLAFWVQGMDLGVMAIIGILGLAGVVVNDSLVMASTINDQAADGINNAREAIVAGAKKRYRAVVLTSLTTLAGVFPLAYGVAGKAGWLQPMVMAVGWGLLFATLLTLLFIPCLLLMIDDARRVGRWVRARVRTTKST